MELSQNTNFDIVNIVVPMAGSGTRFSERGYKINKPFLPLGNTTMIGAVCKNLYNPYLVFFFIANKQNTNKQQLDSEINKQIKNYEIIWTDKLTKGPAMSCFLAKEFINNDIPLIIANCDQIIEDLDYKQFFNFCNYHNPDGVLGVFSSASPKNSYVKINDNNEVIELKEKVVISKLATNGFHYWRKGKFFIESVEEMVKNNDNVNGEYYISISYNYMLKQSMKVIPFHFNMHFALGVPEDYERYKAARNL